MVQTGIANPQIDATLAELLAGSRAILAGNLFGMYVFGSLASGGFDDETSDIDFVVITRAEVGAEERAALGELNKRLQATARPWATKLEGSFLPLHVFEDFNPACTPYPTIGMGGKYGLDHKGIEHPLQRCMLREDGITLAGPEPKTFIGPVGAEELREATRALLRAWWAPQLDNPARMQRRGYQAYAVLTMCRMLYTLEQGGVTSKPAAARWAVQRLPDRWRGPIDRALAWRDGDGVDDLAPALDLIRYTLGQAKPNSPIVSKTSPSWTIVFASLLLGACNFTPPAERFPASDPRNTLTLAVEGTMDEGPEELFTGTVARRLENEGVLTIASDRGLRCRGYFAYVSRHEARGSLDCTNGLSGPFQFESQGKRGKGTGRIAGRRFTFVFG
jgi:hypothetical protein